MDVFIPSLPDMAKHFNASPGAIQLTLSIFMTSYGISQLVAGGFVDSYGRFYPSLVSMLVFSAASFVIAYTNSLQLIYWMRAIQGLTVAVIIVSKRAYFVDMFSGDKLKKYTSLFSVIWAIAPIVAPFLGGFFQTTWGWSSNFIFLGYFGLAFFVIELISGGESIKLKQSFRLRPIVSIYTGMLKTQDFTSGMIILGLSYAMILIYGMSSPFLIENRLHFSAAVTGYCSLFSGLSVFIGGSLSRMFIQKPFYKKLLIASGVQLVAVAFFVPVAFYTQNLFTLLLFVFLIHSAGGFIFNNLLSYCLIRFPQHAGKASGLVGGGFSIVTSILSSVLVSSLTITNQMALAAAYGVLSVLVFALLIKTKWGQTAKEGQKEKEAAPVPVLKQQTA